MHCTCICLLFCQVRHSPAKISFRSRILRNEEGWNFEWFPPIWNDDGTQKQHCHIERRRISPSFKIVLDYSEDAFICLLL